MPPTHHANTTNLTHHHPVGAGHARPAGFPLHPVQPKTVGAAYMPPAHLAYTTNPTHRHPVGAGHARPATYPILQLVSIAQQIPNMHLAQKSPSKFVKKTEKPH